MPGEGEGVGWEPGFVGCDGAGEAAVADVAPLLFRLVRGLGLGLGYGDGDGCTGDVPDRRCRR